MRSHARDDRPTATSSAGSSGLSTWFLQFALPAGGQSHRGEGEGPVFWDPCDPAGTPPRHRVLFACGAAVRQTRRNSAARLRPSNPCSGGVGSKDTPFRVRRLERSSVGTGPCRRCHLPSTSRRGAGGGKRRLLQQAGSALSEGNRPDAARIQWQAAHVIDPLYKAFTERLRSIGAGVR